MKCHSVYGESWQRGYEKFGDPCQKVGSKEGDIDSQGQMAGVGKKMKKYRGRNGQKAFYISSRFQESHEIVNQKREMANRVIK